jgi:hypothetical protein
MSEVSSDSAAEAWQPLLDGERARTAWQVVEEIAAALRVAEPATAGEDALFFGQLYRAKGRQEDAELAADLLGRRLGDPSTLPLDLHGGLSGLGWAAQSMGRILDIDVDEACATIDHYILDALLRFEGRFSVDLFGGLVGIGVYLARRAREPTAREALATVVRQLRATAIRGDRGLWWLPAAHDAAGIPGVPASRIECNLGMAHGVPGVIGLLEQAFSIGVEPNLCKELADGAIRCVFSTFATDHGT